MKVFKTKVSTPYLVVEDDSSFLFHVKLDNGNQDIFKVKMLCTTLEVTTVLSLPDEDFNLHVFNLDRNE